MRKIAPPEFHLYTSSALHLYYASFPLGKRIQPILSRKYLELKREGRESEWDACLVSLGARPKSNENRSEREEEEKGEVFVCDPSVKKWPRIITVSGETALKILVLGKLPC